MKNQVQKGDVCTFTATSDVASGQGVLVGKLFGVATGAVKSGAEGELALTSVFELPKAEAQAWSLGELIYWDDANSNCTSVEAGNTKIGHALAVAANPSLIGVVRLSSAA